MNKATKNKIIAAVVAVILILLILLVKDIYIDNYLTVQITNISFLAPSTFEITVSGVMPSNITEKQMYVNAFIPTSSSIVSTTNTDTSIASGAALIAAAFGQNVPMPINSTTNSIITTYTVPKYFTTNQINAINITGTGTILIKQ